MNDAPSAPASAVDVDDPFAAIVDARHRSLKHRPSQTEIVDPNARKLVEAAADAAGLTLHQLIDLIVDSDLLAIPPPPAEITESLTLGQLGTMLHAQAAQVPQAQRAVWFDGLLPKQRLAVVVALRHDGFSAQTVANEFGLPLSSVTKAWTQHAANIGESIVQVRLESIAGFIELAAQRAQEGAARKDDWSTFWRIGKEKIALWQDLGISQRATTQVEVTHKLDEAQAEELRKMVELQRKQDTRREEIKLIEAEVIQGDNLPVDDDIEGDDE